MTVFFFPHQHVFFSKKHILYIKHDIGIDQYSCTGIKNCRSYLINKVMFYYLPHKLYNISVYTFYLFSLYSDLVFMLILLHNSGSSYFIFFLINRHLKHIYPSMHIHASTSCLTLMRQQVWSNVADEIRKCNSDIFIILMSQFKIIGILNAHSRPK